MLFNSWVFLKFFAAFLLLYWLARHHLRARNALIVAGSYVFYGYWNVKLLGLLLVSTLLDYLVGLALARPASPSTRKWLLAISVTGNLTILGFFKYYDFFVESLSALLASAGWNTNMPTLNVILPVGISFYTFQTMSYTIDVYRRVLEPTKDPIAFAAYVAFFPQLVAGPIERANHLLPQFSKSLVITFRMVEEGIWLILWGLFKKVVVADNLAPLVEMVYSTKTDVTGPSVVGATLAFGLQIYGDFSGYSDIARGLAKLLGFELMINFRQPYLATNLREFWRRWHISLSTWMRDYLYISLGGNRDGYHKTCRNLLVTMILAGLWHGAAWHFVLWGIFHGLGLVASHWFSAQGRQNGAASSSGVWALGSWTLTMAFVFYGWLLFRAEDGPQILRFTMALGSWDTPPWIGSYLLNLATFAAPVLLLDFLQGKANRPFVLLESRRWLKATVQCLLLLAILQFWKKADSPFIYFQF